MILARGELSRTCPEVQHVNGPCGTTAPHGGAATKLTGDSRIAFASGTATVSSRSSPRRIRHSLSISPISLGSDSEHGAPLGLRQPSAFTSRHQTTKLLPGIIRAGSWPVGSSIIKVLILSITLTAIREITVVRIYVLLQFERTATMRGSGNTIRQATMVFPFERNDCCGGWIL